MKFKLAFALLKLAALSNLFLTPNVIGAPTFFDGHSRGVLESFAEFKVFYHKHYNSSDHPEKFAAFATSWDLIQQHNERVDTMLSESGGPDNEPFKLGFTPLADAPYKTYREKYLHNLPKSSLDEDAITGEEGMINPFSKHEPKQWDYRQQGCNSTVVKMGPCSSGLLSLLSDSINCQATKQLSKNIHLNWRNIQKCLEKSQAHMIKKSHCILDYSDVDLIDHLTHFSGGIIEDRSCINDETCAMRKTSDCRSRVRLSGYRRITPGDEAELIHALVNKGPVIVWINADDQHFPLYSTGIFHLSPCDTSNLNHPMLLVGYDQAADGTLYWILKNTWSTNWGEGGYIRVRRKEPHTQKTCDITTHAVYPVVENA